MSLPPPSLVSAAPDQAMPSGMLSTLGLAPPSLAPIDWESSSQSSGSLSADASPSACSSQTQSSDSTPTAAPSLMADSISSAHSSQMQSTESTPTGARVEAEEVHRSLQEILICFGEGVSSTVPGASSTVGNPGTDCLSTAGAAQALPARSLSTAAGCFSPAAPPSSVPSAPQVTS